MIWLWLTLGAWAQQNDTAFLRKIEQKFLPPSRFGEEAPAQFTRLEPRPAPPTIHDIVRSPLVQKAVRYRAQLQELEGDGVSVVLERKIIRTYALADESGYFYVANTKGLPTHRVHMNDVVDFKDDVAMYEEPRSWQPVQEIRNVSPYDRPLAWKPEVALLLGRSSSDWTADLLDDQGALHTTGFQAAARWIADFQGQFRLGAVVQFEGATHNIQAGEASYRNYSGGVMLRSRDFEWGGFPWRVCGQFLYGPIGVLSLRSEGDTEDIYLRTTSAVVSWEKPMKNALGEWAWGVSWQRDWPKLRNQQDYVRLDSSSSTNDLVGLFITQGFTW